MKNKNLKEMKNTFEELLGPISDLKVTCRRPSRVIYLASDGPSGIEPIPKSIFTRTIRVNKDTPIYKLLEKVKSDND